MASDQSLKALCHKCRAEMIYVTSLPHPSAPETMRRTTFVCRACNQTRNYSLSLAMAEAYATAYAHAAEPLH
jgi:RNase P subunit RPR2